MNNSYLLPREKLKEKGIQTLSDHELLQGLIGSGNRLRTVKQLATDLLKIIDSQGIVPPYEEIKGIQGFGSAKASSILCALEFVRRRIIPPGIIIQTPGDILEYLRPYRHKKQEHFLCAGLSGSHELLYLDVITIGILNKSLIHPREVFEKAITRSVHSIIVCHNHPSGNLTPSPEDIEVTGRLKTTGDILGIPVLDHIIITKVGHYSFLEHNRL